MDVDRAYLRTTLTYQLASSLSVGLEYNPKADDIGPLANWRVFDETEKLPALILGTSSDRIGTDHGRSYYATLSKSLARETKLPIAPYVGVAFGEAQDRFATLAGLSVAWSEAFTSFHSYDGFNIHHTLEYALDRHVFGLVLAEVDDSHFIGLSYSIGFSMPWE